MGNQSKIYEIIDKSLQDPSSVLTFQAEDSRIKLKRLYPDIEKYHKERDERRAAKLAEK